MAYKGLALVAIVCSFSGAQEAEEPVYNLGQGITPPRVTHQVSPNAGKGKGFRVNGVVLIGLVVTSKGEPRQVHVVNSIEKEIDQAALDAVQQWRFEPARKDGAPVAVHVSVEIRFHDM